MPCIDNLSRTIVAVAALLLAAPAGAAIVLGQVDDFEDGTLQSWEAGGARNPVGPTNVATGGPAGANDNFLRLRSDGGGPGGKLVVFNSGQWAGDYLAAGVSAIQMQVNNVGSTDLVLRLILITGSSSGASGLGTVAPVELPSGSGWQTVTFSLAASNLAGGDYAAIMSNVTELSLAHSTDFIDARRGATEIVAQLRVDNIAAVPEPHSALLLASGLLGLLLLSAARRARASRG